MAHSQQQIPFHAFAFKSMLGVVGGEIPQELLQAVLEGSDSLDLMFI